MSVGKAGAQLPKILPQPGHLEQGGIRVPPAAPVELVVQVGGFFCQTGLGAGGDQGPPPAAQHLRLQGLDEALQEVRESLGGSGPPQPSPKCAPHRGAGWFFPTFILRSSSERRSHQSRLSVQLLASFCSFWMASKSLSTERSGACRRKGAVIRAPNMAGLPLSHPCPHLGERSGDADVHGSGAFLQPCQQQRVPYGARLDAGEGQHAHGHP